MKPSLAGSVVTVIICAAGLGFGLAIHPVVGIFVALFGFAKVRA